MFQSIRGTFDVLPEGHDIAGRSVPGSPSWRHVEATVREVMERFGMEEIRTPMMEPAELVARGVGQATDIVQKEMFLIERGGETYVLRPEVTAPVMRAFLEHHLAQRGGTQRLYYIGPCFRAERPQKGRYRQFHQFGVELIGSAEPVADVEAIANLMSVAEAFDLTNLRLRLNTIGDTEDRPRYREALRDYFEPFKNDLTETSRQRLETNPLRILDTKTEHERVMLAEAPRLPDFVSDDARAHHEAVTGFLDDLGIAYDSDPFLVRGLDYYTRTAFELESDVLGAQSALGGGGRYDGLAQAVGGGEPVPAVGYAAGVERFLLALAAQDYAFPEAPHPDAFLITIGDEAKRWAVTAAHNLRKAGLRVEMDLLDRSIGKQFKEADREKAHVAVIVGPDDLAEGEAQMKHLPSGEQQAVPLKDLEARIRMRLRRRSGGTAST